MHFFKILANFLVKKKILNLMVSIFLLKLIRTKCSSYSGIIRPKHNCQKIQNHSLNNLQKCWHKHKNNRIFSYLSIKSCVLNKKKVESRWCLTAVISFCFIGSCDWLAEKKFPCNKLANTAFPWWYPAS